jgi:hypothetical protein
MKTSVHCQPPAAGPAVLQLPQAKGGREARAARIQSDFTMRKSQDLTRLAPASLEVGPQALQRAGAENAVRRGKDKPRGKAHQDSIQSNYAICSSILSSHP